MEEQQKIQERMMECEGKIREILAEYNAVILYQETRVNGELARFMMTCAPNKVEPLNPETDPNKVEPLNSETDANN